ncbi:MAG TPA: 30S ribosomal protein S21 [Candidatus Paceibacterota bacterium]|nr:30S ribosomal protein S21 [Candidatus Paceibacterota bacterium]
MPVEVRRKEGETLNAFLFRFSKKVKHSGILKESKKRRFHDRNVNRNKRRLSAIYRVKQSEERRRQKKHGRLKRI